MLKSFSSKLNPLSVLDRLIDKAPEKNTDDHLTGKELTEQLIDDIRRDLSNIINTRKRFLSFPVVFKELNSSVICYGMEDFTNYLFFSKENQEILCSDIEKAVTLYESRLKNVKVSLEQDENVNNGVIQFNIEAEFNAKETSYPLFMRVSLSIKTNAYKIWEVDLGYAG